MVLEAFMRKQIPVMNASVGLGKKGVFTYRPFLNEPNPPKVDQKVDQQKIDYSTVSVHSKEDLELWVVFTLNTPDAAIVVFLWCSGYISPQRNLHIIVIFVT